MWRVRRLAPMVAGAISLGVAFAAACDFGVDLQGLTDGSADASSDVTFDAPIPSIPIVALALGGAHTCGVRKDGTVVCWGSNAQGRLGNGSSFDSSTPVVVVGLGHVTQIAAGAEHVCALRDDGSVVCWGDNDYGQLGDGTITTRPTFVVSEGLTSAVVQIAASGYSTCALLQGGTVECWGQNLNGELGDGTTNEHNTAQPVMNLTNIGSIDGGGDHFCALTNAGVAWCWGQNASGQIGNGMTADVSIPVKVMGLGVASAISAGANHTCAIVSGNVFCFGLDSNGQLGDSQSAVETTPVQVGVSPNWLTGATSVSAGGAFTCANTAAGIQCWGSGYAGQLGTGMLKGAGIPVAVVGNPALQVTAGSLHACALVAGGGVECWGFNANGRLGIGNPLFNPQPAVVQSFSGALELTVGADHSCALTDAGDVCWGDNQDGQLAANTGVVAASGTPVVATQGLTGLAAGASHTCGLDGDGGVWCFGYNYYGQLGNGSSTNSSTPQRFGGSFVGRNIAAGTSHTCVVATTGTVGCVGANGSGQLGNDTTSNSFSVVSVLRTPDAGLTGADFVTSGTAEGCATTDAGALLCWGSNTSGQTGDGNEQPATVATPVTILDGGLPISLAHGGAHTCAVRADGKVLCWGSGGFGQLGDGNGMTTWTMPTIASTSMGAKDVATGNNHSCAILVDGTVECWGYNQLGELGNSSQGILGVNQLSPVPVMGITNAVRIRAGGEDTCVLLADGSARCWGQNTDGQLGDGTVTAVPTPTYVVGL